MQSLMTRLLLGGGGGFSPSALFASGEQGAWYDPSDLTTLFQDSAGTTPVTAVEQPVGLVLDKSKGLVLGSELVTNGDFSQGSTGWTLTSSSVSGGALSVTSITTENVAVNTAIIPSTSTWYYVSFDLTVTSGTLSVFCSQLAAANKFGSNITTSGRKTGYVFVGLPGGGNNAIIFRSEGGFVGTIDNISVKAIPGNHAYQTTSASRPTLRARYNLLTYSEQFNVGSMWGTFNATITPNQAIAPDGTLTADTLSQTTADGAVIGTNALIAGTYNLSIRAKANTSSSITLGANIAGNGRTATFTLTGNGTAGAVSQLGTGGTVSGGTSSILALENGWYECRISNISMSGTNSFVVGTGGINSVFIWGAQATNPAVFPSNAYQRIAAATDYATGAAFPPYLFFDGVDDSLLTNSVDFSATDKMTVWAGVTKSSDAATGILAELSASVTTFNGSFYLAAPELAAHSYSFLNRGAAIISSNQLASTPLATYPAPRTNVILATGDIAGDLNTIRVNGVSGTSATGDQGTGNFGNYPLYIGRRNNATIPLNGNIYSLIIRGAATASPQLISTEQWVAQKSGITIP